MPLYFDTHAHYDDGRFDEDREAVLDSMQEAGVALIVNVGCDLATSESSIRLAQTYDFFYATVGCHPHDAEKMTDDDLDRYRALAQNDKVVAIGEIGLDYHYDLSPRDVQRKRFAQQLDLAVELELPVVIHEREAHGECMDILRPYFGRLRGEFHCYSGAVEMAKELVKAGWYLGFNGSCTFKNARKPLEVIEYCPMDRILLETDCPYLTPVPHRGKRNDSRYLPYVAETIARVKGMTVEDVARRTMENGKRFFAIDQTIPG
jgi:TatD DNase family protein